MKQPPAEIVTLMSVAAELRAGGGTWDSIALQVQRTPRTCRSWPVRYPEVWQQIYLDAEERLLEEAGAESLFSLRKLLRVTDPWLQQNTAKFLFTQRRQARAQRQATAAVQATQHGDWAPFIAYLETLSDVQVQAFLQQFLARRMAQARPAVPAAGGEASPAVGQ